MSYRLTLIVGVYGFTKFFLGNEMTQVQNGIHFCKVVLTFYDAGFFMK